jgi:hypothetical protein
MYCKCRQNIKLRFTIIPDHSIVSVGKRKDLKNVENIKSNSRQKPIKATASNDIQGSRRTTRNPNETQIPIWI